MAKKKLTASNRATSKKSKKDSGQDTYIIQVLGLVLLLLALMTTSVVAALMATGVIDISQESGGLANSVTMTDAQAICAKSIQAEYGAKLQAFALDDLSSRGDDAGGFKMFYDLTLFRGNSRNSGVSDFYVNCFVSSSGRARRLELIKEKPHASKAGKRTHGNVFGF